MEKWEKQNSITLTVFGPVILLPTVVSIRAGGYIEGNGAEFSFKIKSP